MAVMKRRYSMKTIVFIFVFVLIAYRSILFFTELLQQQVEKLFIKNSSFSTKCAHCSHEEITKTVININLHVELPPYEITMETFPNDGSFRIERIIHQTWIDKNIPNDFQKYISELKKNHPSYVYMFWTDALAKQFVEYMFPILLPFYVNYRHNLQRADAIRYMILYEYGGVYADLDIVSLRPLDPILRKYSCVLSQEPHVHSIFYSNFYGSACNAFMACRRHHPFMMSVMENLPSFSVASEVLDSTGPRFMTIVYRNYIVDHPHINKTNVDGVYLAPPEYFMPSSDPTLQTKVETLCSKTVLANLQKWLCEKFKRQGLGGPVNSTFTDHKWTHFTMSSKSNKKKKTFDIRKIIPDVKFYMQETSKQTMIIAKEIPNS